VTVADQNPVVVGPVVTDALLQLVAGQAATAAKVDALLSRVDSIDTTLGRVQHSQEGGDRELEDRIAKLERWQAKVIGLAFGVGIGSGALASYITAALTP